MVAKERYEKRRDCYLRLNQKHVKAINTISNLRLLVFISGIALTVFLFIIKYYIIMAAIFIAFAFLFGYLMVQHDKLFKAKMYSSMLVKINEDSLKRINGEWDTFLDDGKDFLDGNHEYAYDLDIFGNRSMFQWINVANTYLGRKALGGLLSGSSKDAARIKMRQEAVKELALKLGWRHRFLAEGLVVSNNMKNPEKLIDWANEEHSFYRKTWLNIIVKVLPAVTILSLILSIWISAIPYYIPAILIIVQYFILRYKRLERHEIFNTADKFNKDIRVYYKMLKLFENKKFEATLIKEISTKMAGKVAKPAYEQVNRLAKIIDSISNRHAPFYFVFNILTLWDYHNMITLEKWKDVSGRYLKAWLEGIGDVEALASLAIINHDNPDWVMPEISEGDKESFEAVQMGHPLITLNRVYNNLNFNSPTKVLLITGSNMSGKSTLLRTAGINLALAYTGAPVCAQVFRASIMDIHSCMRVSDDLGKSISSFYAELLRIKEILKEAKEGRKVFFLLDEIFKGTNSRDRHTGARVLIEELSRTKSIGMVSTHDFELCDLELKNQKIRNYHFEEYYKDNKIHFDYKLRNGVSTTRNAIYLMKMAGIDIDESAL
ncbi:MutS family DNA mismatch repair protein [Acetivibrio cellulolyticus]|uniref:MutS family DNA mismatch repair protein n=1 Tax=Acetivibrio cellulolyticus TaxID=35830 RepID=UPI0001E2E7AC|nr:MutS family DNA mismatch repair protein [Acetivibrio cellulolyticus]